MSLIQETIANTKDSTREDLFLVDDSSGLHFPCSVCIRGTGALADDPDVPSECPKCRYFFN